jgi:hypothetical protein
MQGSSWLLSCLQYPTAVQLSYLQASGWLLNCLQHPNAVQISYLQASGWLLSCLQYPTAVHLYVVPSHTKPGIAENFLRDLQVFPKFFSFKFLSLILDGGNSSLVTWQPYCQHLPVPTPVYTLCF